MQKTIGFVIAILIVSAGAFSGGMLYGKSQTAADRSSRGQFQNLTPEQRQQRFQQGNNVDGNVQRRGGGAAGGFVTGEILSQDNQSVTVKLVDGGSKIIFFSASTTIGKFSTGVAGDLTVGENIMANGTTNSDGSFTAQMIQIRPAGAPGMQMRQFAPPTNQ